MPPVKVAGSPIYSMLGFMRDVVWGVEMLSLDKILNADKELA